MVKNNGWSAYLVETTSGRVGTRINIASPTWTKTLNGIASGSVTARSSELYRIDRKWFSPDYGSVLLTYTYEGIEKCIVAGPITDWPSEDENTLQIAFTDIRGLLQDRLALRNDSVTAKRKVSFSGMSLGTIAQEVATVAQDRPGGRLPITFGTPQELWSPGHQRTYEPFNVANLDADEVFTKLSEVIDGPDIMFRPEFTDEGKSRIVWKMVNGTRYQQALAQDSIPSFDVTASRSGVTDYKAYVGAARRINRVYVTGAGEDAATLIVVHEDLESVEEGYPFRETVLSETSEERTEVLLEKAKQYVEENKNPIVQVSMTIRADHPNYPLGNWDVGDRVKITVPQRHALPAGTYQMIIIEASGGEGQNINLKLQED